MGDENTEKTINSELENAAETPDDDKRDYLNLNGFKVDFAIGKKIEGELDEATEEEQLEILAVRNGRYYSRYLSNEQAHEVSTKTSKTSKNVTDIYNMLCGAAAGDPSLEVEISDEGIFKFKSFVKYGWSKKSEEDNLEIQLEEEHLDSLELIRRLLKSSYLDSASLNVFNNFLDHCEKVQQDMATKMEFANLESFQGLIKEVKDSIAQAETSLASTRNEITGWKTAQATELTGLRAEVSGLKTAQTADASGLKAVQAELSSLKTAQAEDANGINGLRTEINGIKNVQTTDTNGLKAVQTELKTAQTADANAIKAAQADINGLRTELTGMKTVQTELNTLKTAQAADANGINGLKTDVGGLKTAQAADANLIKAAQADIATLKSENAGMKDTIETLKKKLSELETNLAAVKAQQQVAAPAQG